MEKILQKNTRTTFKVQELLSKSRSKPMKIGNLKQFVSEHQNLHITSPFYARNLCNKGSKCKCPFHTRKKINIIPTIQFPKRTNISASLHQKGSRAERIHINTQGNESKESFVPQKDKYTKNKLNTVTNGFFKAKDYKQINHKVACRNQSFEQFLRKKQLYILTGKLPTEQAMQQNEIFEEFQDYIMRQLTLGQNHIRREKNEYQQMQNSKNNLRANYDNRAQRSLADKKQKKDPRLNIKKNLTQCEKIQKIVQLLVEGKKNMTLNQKKLLERKIQHLIAEERTKDPLSKNIAFYQMYIKKLEDLIGKQQEGRNKKEFQGKTHSKHESQRSSKHSNRREIYEQNQENPAFRYRLKNSGKKTNKSKKPSDFQQKRSFRSGRESQSSLTAMDKSQYLGKKKNKNSRKSQMFECSEKKQNQPYCNTKKTDEIMKQSAREENEDSDQKNFYRSTNAGAETISQVKKTKLLRTKRKESFSQYLLNKKFLSEQSEFQSYLNQKGDQRLSKFYEGSMDIMKKNGRCQNLKELINCRTEADETEKMNFERLRKKIQRNKNFIKRMREILEKLDLKDLIIQENDSLITQRKKIRHLSQMAPQNKSKLSFQLNHYLQLYSQHCGQILRKPFVIQSSHQQFINQSIFGKPLEKEQFDFHVHEEKEINKSLKFIDLNRPEEEIKELKDTNWVQIHQYTTHDERRKNRIETILKKMSDVTTVFMPEKRIEAETRGEGDLIQKNLQNKVKIETPVFINAEKECLQTRNFDGNGEKKENEQVKIEDPFAQKLKQYRNLLIKSINNRQNEDRCER